jgi:hypothetical protein
MNGWQHSLSFAVRFDDHFFGEPVPEELPVRLSPSQRRPVKGPSGKARQSDGTYRFVDVEPGSHRVLWLPPFEDAFRTWTSWGPPLEVSVPLADPAAVVVADLWPTPEAGVRAGTTAIRGKVVGPGAAGLGVSLTRTGSPPTDRTSRTDRFGEFLFPLPMRLEPNAANLLPLTVRVAGRTVSRCVAEPIGTEFPGADFTVRAGVVTRVKFFLA